MPYLHSELVLVGVYKTYWHIRLWYSRLRFTIFTSGFRARFSFFNISSDFNIISSIFLGVIWAIITSVIFAVFILLFSVLVEQWTVGAILPTWLSTLLGQVDQANGSSYDSILVGVITVIGIFLTLYLTSVNTVAGTLYAKAPKRVRDLLVRERVGNIYIWFLISLTIICLTLLVTAVIWNIRPNLAILFVALLGGFAVVAFVQLAWRVFLFFDPTSLADVLFTELIRWSKHATIRGYLWDDISFQDHYRRQASEAIFGIKSLVTIAHDEPHLQREALSTLLTKIAIFISAYQSFKAIIPTNSKWWKVIPHHKDWYLSASNEISIATETYTTLQPAMKPDINWVEQELLALHLDSLNRCLNDGRVGVALRMMEVQSDVFSAIGSSWNVAYWEELLLRITQTVQSFLIHPDQTDVTSVLGSSRRTEEMAIVDYLGLLPINLLLGFFRNLETIDADRLTQKLNNVLWYRKSEIYRLGLPVASLERIESIQRSLLFEKETEDCVISPHWYIKLLIFQSLSEVFFTQIMSIIKIGEEFYRINSRNWLDASKPVLAAELISRGLEFHNKLRFHLPSMQKVTAELEAANRLKMLPWPTWDWDKIMFQVSESQKALVKSLAQCIPGLTNIVFSEDTPDYFGHSVHMVGEECFHALVNNDVDTFSVIFPHYFDGVLAIYNRLSKKTMDWHPSSALVTNLEPLIDLCDLSGYTLFFAELHNNPSMWDNCKQLWEIYLTKDTSHNQIKTWAKIIKTKTQLIGGHRSLLRTRWKMQVNRVLRELPRKPYLHHPQNPIRGYIDIADHPSLIVQVLGGRGSNPMMTFYEGVDVFVDLYLKQRSEAKDLSFGRNRDLADAIERRKSLDKEIGYGKDDKNHVADEDDLGA